MQLFVIFGITLSCIHTLRKVIEFIKYVTKKDLCSITWIPVGEANLDYLNCLGKLARGGVVEQAHVPTLCRYYLLHVTVRDICSDVRDICSDVLDIPTAERQRKIEGYAGAHGLVPDEERIVITAVSKHLEDAISMDDVISQQDLIALHSPGSLQCNGMDANAPAADTPITVSAVAGIDESLTVTMNEIWQWKDSQGKWHLYDDIHMKKLEKEYSRRCTGSCLLIKNMESVRVVFRHPMHERSVQGGTKSEVQRLVLSDAELTTLEIEMGVIDYC